MNEIINFIIATLCILFPLMLGVFWWYEIITKKYKSVKVRSYMNKHGHYPTWFYYSDKSVYRAFFAPHIYKSYSNTNQELLQQKWEKYVDQMFADSGLGGKNVDQLYDQFLEKVGSVKYMSRNEIDLKFNNIANKSWNISHVEDFYFRELLDQAKDEETINAIYIHKLKYLHDLAPIYFHDNDKQKLKKEEAKLQKNFKELYFKDNLPSSYYPLDAIRAIALFRNSTIVSNPDGSVIFTCNNGTRNGYDRNRNTYKYIPSMSLEVMLMTKHVADGNKLPIPYYLKSVPMKLYPDYAKDYDNSHLHKMQKSTVDFLFD